MPQQLFLIFVSSNTKWETALQLVPQARDVEPEYNDKMVVHVNQVQRGSQTKAQLLAGLEAHVAQRIGPELLTVWRWDQQKSKHQLRSEIEGNEQAGWYKIGTVLFAILLTLVGPVGFLSNWRKPGYIVDSLDDSAAVPLVFCALIGIAGLVIHWNLE